MKEFEKLNDILICGFHFGLDTDQPCQIAIWLVAITMATPVQEHAKAGLVIRRHRDRQRCSLRESLPNRFLDDFPPVPDLVGAQHRLM